MKYLTDKITWTDSMKEFAEDQVKSKLYRIVDNFESTEIKISKTGPETLKVAVTLDAFRAQAIDEDFYIALSTALNKLKVLVIKSAKKQVSGQKAKQLQFTEALDITELSAISKDKTLILTNMTVDEAIDGFEKTDYNFYIFKDIDCENVISVIYKKFDNTYGVIRCK